MQVGEPAQYCFRACRFTRDRRLFFLLKSPSGRPGRAPYFGVRGSPEQASRPNAHRQSGNEAGGKLSEPAKVKILEGDVNQSETKGVVSR